MKICLKWTTKRQHWSVNHDSCIVNLSSGKYNISVNERLAKGKEKGSTIQLVVFVL